MDSKLKLAVLVSASLLLLALGAKKPIDPYKVLGVDRKANQRQIQKAFHKLSLQYHPDKNKNKGAQEKFEEINNAYEILSDEDKRKNYDLYGDERGGPSFGGGNNEEDYGGYSYFKSGGSGQGGFNFRPGGWQDMGGQGKSQSFSFSFGGPSGGNSFGDLFSNFFGGDAGGGGGGFNFGGFGGSSGSHFGGFQGSSGSKSGTKSTPKNVRAVTSQLFQKEIYDKGIVWILVSYTQSIGVDQQQESILEEVAHSLKGAIKVGKINCGNELSFCKSHGIQPRRYARVFVYSYVKSDSGSFVEYNDEWDAKVLKSFCQEHIPRFSRRVRMDEFSVSDDASGEAGLPRVVLLSTKKDTPMIWRVLSGLYRRRFIFYDTKVQDVSDPNVRKLGVDALPAIVGWLPNGERQTLKTGIAVKDLESAVKDISVLLDRFEKKSKKVASKKSGAESSSEKQIPILVASNMDSVCGESASLCIIGVFRSSKSKQKLESLVSIVGQKSLSRRRNSDMLFGVSKDGVTYALLDGTKQQSFLSAFDEKLGSKSTSGSEPLILLAYKPRKGKYAALASDLDLDTEEVEKFVSSVLSGDVQFSKTKHKPALKSS